MDVRNDTTTGNGGLDERVQFLVTTDSELEMSWGDTFYFKILAGVACQFQHLGGQVLQDGS